MQIFFYCTESLHQVLSLDQENICFTVACQSALVPELNWNINITLHNGATLEIYLMRGEPFHEVH